MIDPRKRVEHRTASYIAFQTIVNRRNIALTEVGSGIDRFEHSSENCQPLCAGLQSHHGNSLHIVMCLVASILVHLALFAVTLHAIRRARFRDSYVYITLASPRTGIAVPQRRSPFGTSNHGSTTHISRALRHVARSYLAPRREKANIRKLISPKPKSPVSGESLGARATATKPQDNNHGGNVLNERHRDDLPAGKPSGIASSGAQSGLAVYQPPVLLSRIMPAYPERARSMGIQGQVVVQFIVDQSGRVERDIQVLTSLPMLDEAAIEAVRQWRFSPARDRFGNPVRVLVSVPLQFSLQ